MSGVTIHSGLFLAASALMLYNIGISMLALYHTRTASEKHAPPTHSKSCLKSQERGVLLGAHSSHFQGGCAHFQNLMHTKEVQGNRMCILAAVLGSNQSQYRHALYVSWPLCFALSGMLMIDQNKPKGLTQLFKPLWDRS